jgi:hypothetical protein
MVGLCVNTALALLDGSGMKADPWLIQSLLDFDEFVAVKSMISIIIVQMENVS